MKTKVRSVVRALRAALASRSTRRARAHEGMTLIEIMVVVIIMALIASAVGIGVFRQLASSRIKLTQQAVRTISSAIQIYQNDHPDVCPTIEQLQQDGALDRNAASQDPWSHAFAITCDGENIVVASGGPDGRAGTGDDIVFPPTGH